MGIVISVNESPLISAHLSEKDVIGIPLEECYWWSYSEKSKYSIRRALIKSRRGSIVRYDIKSRMSEERFLILDFNVAPIYDYYGNVKYLIVSGIDITNRKQMEEEIRNREENFRILADTIPQIVWVANKDGINEYVNSRAIKYLGTEFNRPEPINWSKFIHPEDEKTMNEKWTQSLKNRRNI